ncbi:MAG: hypothetical protein AB1589_15760 [Cyanobacteriota bacterium]
MFFIPSLSLLPVGLAGCGHAPVGDLPKILERQSQPTTYDPTRWRSQF